jgi:hypothetical protein
MAHLTYHPMSKPHRWLLGVVCGCVIVLTVVMMARAMEFGARTAATVAVETVASDEDYGPRSPVPLPAGPKRYQEPHRPSPDTASPVD